MKEYENGELVEHTLDYYAQHRNGSVWYFGERVYDYKDGKIVGRHGQWLAGQGNAKAGLFMPARPKVGQAFQQERAPGVAEDRSTVVAVGLRVTTPAGTFRNCIKTSSAAGTTVSAWDAIRTFRSTIAGKTIGGWGTHRCGGSPPPAALGRLSLCG